jgi:ATP-dependent DNA helicase PIF1
MSILSNPIQINSSAAGVIITQEMKTALSAIARGESPVFISGGAGTGKSTLLKLIREQANPTLAVLAPTGIAALNVRGVTIHSFFRFPPRLMTQHEFRRSPTARDIYRQLSGIIIDEVSMVRADLLDAIDATLRVHLDPRLPFGGVQIVVMGDLSQLPPVLAGEELQQHFSKMYESRFFFDAQCLRFSDLRRYELTKTFRQMEQEFVATLNRLRTAAITMEDMQKLNSRVDAKAGNSHEITLTATRRLAEDINRKELDGLPGTERQFRAIITGAIDSSEFPADETLRLKPGARIMMLQNNGDIWQNGTLGTILEFGQFDGKEAVRVSLPNGVFWLQRNTWEVIRYVRNPAGPGLKEDIVGTFVQFPLRLAWAVTVHKCQGMTFDRVYVNLDHQPFEHGQLYVALSRCRSLSGIRISRAVRTSDIKYHPRVSWFEKQSR